MNVFESCHEAATFLYGQDHPEVYDPRLPSWALERHIEECQKLEDELLTAEIDGFARDMGLEEKEEAWYNGLLEEQMLAEEEFIREFGPMGPCFEPGIDDDSWPDESTLRDWRFAAS